MNTRYPIALLALTCLLISPLVRAQGVGDRELERLEQRITTYSNDPFQKIVTYTVEQSRKDCAAVEAEVRKATPPEYPALEARLLAVLKSPDATGDCKNFVCRQLATAGSPVCVPAVAPLLLDEKTSHMARFALEPNLSPAAGAALRAALPQVKGKLLVGVISSIGVRRDAQAVEALAALVVSDDSAVAMAAIAAIGNIGVGDAIKALEGAKVAPNLRSAIATAQITAARHLARSVIASGSGSASSSTHNEQWAERARWTSCPSIGVPARACSSTARAGSALRRVRSVMPGRTASRSAAVDVRVSAVAPIAGAASASRPSPSVASGPATPVAPRSDAATVPRAVASTWRATSSMSFMKAARSIGSTVSSASGPAGGASSGGGSGAGGSSATRSDASAV